MNALFVALLSVPLAVPMGSVLAHAESAPPANVWNFDEEQPGILPTQFSIGTLFDGRPAGDRQVLATERAKNPPHAFAHVMAKGAEHAYKVVLIEEAIASDLDLHVSFLPIQGNGDMGGCVIRRAADDRNYYLQEPTLWNNTSACIES